jgi:hypothetical protein
MSSKNLVIELKSRKDKNGQTFYVGKLKSPVLIDCHDGVVFLVYTAEQGVEELQIAAMDTKDVDDQNAF